MVRSELISIYRLEFYKKKTKWIISRDPTKNSAPPVQPAQILDASKEPTPDELRAGVVALPDSSSRREVTSAEVERRASCAADEPAGAQDAAPRQLAGDEWLLRTCAAAGGCGLQCACEVSWARFARGAHRAPHSSALDLRPELAGAADGDADGSRASDEDASAGERALRRLLAAHRPVATGPAAAAVRPRSADVSPDASAAEGGLGGTVVCIEFGRPRRVRRDPEPHVSHYISNY